MASLTDSLATRTIVILLGTLVLVQGLLAGAMLSGPGAYPIEHTLPLPRQIVAIVAALEHTAPSERSRLLAALNSPVMDIQLLTDFPPLDAGERPAPLMRQLFLSYSQALQHRQLRIDDEGPGIPPAQIPRLLRPFERLEESRDRSTGGTGLGLAIVHALVQKAGGRSQSRTGPRAGCRASSPYRSRALSLPNGSPPAPKPLSKRPFPPRPKSPHTRTTKNPDFYAVVSGH